MIGTGIKRLDDILGGGIREGHSVIISGLFNEDAPICFSLLTRAIRFTYIVLVPLLR